MKFRTKFSGPTDTRGARIIVTGGGHRFQIPYDYAAKDKHAAAMEIVKAKLGLTGTIQEIRDHVWTVGPWQPKTGQRWGGVSRIARTRRLRRGLRPRRSLATASAN